MEQHEDKSTSNIIAAFGIVGMLLIGISLAADGWNKAQQHIADENKCIAELVELGIERSEIIADDGECYVRD